MALTTAQLAAAISSSAVTLTLTNIVAPAGGSVLPAVGALPLPIGVPMLMDTEFVFLVAQPTPGIYTIRGRGSEGTAAAAHDILTNCYASLIPSDFGLPQPGTVVTIDPAEDMAVSIGQDGTVVLTGANTIFNINKATAAALVLPAPSQADNGVACVFTSNTAFAHVITAQTTGNFKDGVAARNTATFAAQPGATLTFVAENGAWNVQALQSVTLS